MTVSAALRKVDDALAALVEARRALALMDDEEVPEVEVVTSNLPERLVGQPVIPMRRSGAQNVSPPHLQTAFIDEARAAMGQPNQHDVMLLLGKVVKLVFNDDTDPFIGKLVEINTHPAGPRVVVEIEGDRGPSRTVQYPLNAIQSIEAVV